MEDIYEVYQLALSNALYAGRIDEGKLRNYTQELDENEQDSFSQDELNHIVDLMKPAIEKLEEYRDKNDYPMCYRGVYAAILYDKDAKSIYDGPAYNSPGEDMAAFCKGSTCIRDIVGRVSYTNYDNCPAIHAAENLLFKSKTGLVWVETGLTRVGKELVQWGMRGKIYPCIRCLSHMNNQGIKTFADIYDGAIRVHNVKAHLMHLIVKNSLNPEAKI